MDQGQCEALVEPGRLGEVVRAQCALWLPPNFVSDQYTVRVTVMAEDGKILDTLNLSQIEVKGK